MAHPVGKGAPVPVGHASVGMGHSLVIVGKEGVGLSPGLECGLIGHAGAAKVPDPRAARVKRVWTFISVDIKCTEDIKAAPLKQMNVGKVQDVGNFDDGGRRNSRTLSLIGFINTYGRQIIGANRSETVNNDCAPLGPGGLSSV